MRIGSWIYRKLSRFFENPLRTLAVVLLILIAINYKTFLSHLPRAAPELENFIADAVPLRLTLSGKVTVSGTECWRMRYTFFTEDGGRLISDRDHTVQIGTIEPEAAISLPLRSAYRLRLQAESVNATVDNGCLPYGTAANLGAKSSEQVLRGLVDGSTLFNDCLFASAGNNCTLDIRPPAPAPG